MGATASFRSKRVQRQLLFAHKSAFAIKKNQTGTGMNRTYEATPPSERHVALDALRGFAVLGILIMNIQSFSMVETAYINPTSHGDFTGINKWIWIISHIFADQKFISIFSIMFGAGIILFTERLQAKELSAVSLHYRRTFWLILIGMLHAY